MKLGELFVELGVKADTLNVKSFSRAIGEIPGESLAAIAAIAGIDYQLGRLVVNAFNTALGLKMFAAQTGLSTDALQSWRMVAEQVGVSSETMTSSFVSLQRALERIRYTGQGAGPFLMLGVDPRGDVLAVLAKLRERIHQMPRKDFMYWMAQTGISPELARVLELSDAEFDKLAKHAALSKEKVDALADAFKTMKGVAIDIGQAVATITSNIVNSAEKNANFRHVLEGVGLGLAAIAVWAAPLAATSAALAGIVLALNELADFMNSDKSLGDWVGDKAEGPLLKFKSWIEEFDKKVSAKYPVGPNTPAFGELGSKVAQFFSASPATGTVTNNYETTIHAPGQNGEELGSAFDRHIKRKITGADAQTNVGGQK